MSDKDNLQFAKDSFSITNHWIESADKKATFILTVTLALFTISLTAAPNVLDVITGLLHKSQIQLFLFGFLLIIFSIIYVAIVLFALLILIDIISPRLSPHSKRNSILFFESVTKMGIEEYKDQAKSFEAKHIENEYLDQAYNNSVITSEKFKKIKKAICCLKLAGIFGLLLIFIGIIFS